MLELPVESEIWEPIAEVQEEPQQVSSATIICLTILAVQDRSISDIVGPLVGVSEPTNNQSLQSLVDI